METLINPICIYHNNCPDGFGSAWVIYNKFGNEFEYHGANYSDTVIPDTTDRDVFLVDFCYNTETINHIKLFANSVTVIDHHVNAVDKLKNVDGVNTYLDLHHSGCVLTWKYFNKNEPVPEFLKYIEDRDLWKFKLPNSKEITTAILSYEYDFDNWNILNATSIKTLISEGIALYRKHLKDVKELIKTTKKRIRIFEYEVPIANAPYCYASDICDIMNKNEPFALSYYVKNNDSLYVSIRSDVNGSNIDVNEIAKKFGGGGHRNAAGFEIKIDSDLIQNLILRYQFGLAFSPGY